MSDDAPKPQNISYLPSEGLCYDPNDRRYWDQRLLDKEIERVFEVCHGCRLCFKYCESFPTLFRLLDQKHEGDVHRIDAAEKREIFGHCFQCKLCEVQCPYTPRDQHPFQLDFPKLAHRYRAVVARREGVPVRLRVLSDPDGLGRMARASFGLANGLNRSRANRVVMEKVAGIHRDKLLPDFAPQTFEAWARKAGRTAAAPGAEVALFQTCFVQNNDPGIGRDTLAVLEASGVRAACVEGLVCCGMPSWEHGDLDALRANAARNLDRLLPFVEAGARVLAINPTCGMMLRREYPDLVAPGDRARAEALAAAVRDPGEFLWSLRETGRLSTAFKSTPGPIAYHVPCHLRAQAVGFRSRDLLRKIPGVKARTVMECSGHDGTFAMRAETFEESRRVGARSFTAMKDGEEETWVSDCPLAALQLEQHAGRKTLHSMTVLARAYREDGFPQRVEEATP